MVSEKEPLHFSLRKKMFINFFELLKRYAYLQTFKKSINAQL